MQKYGIGQERSQRETVQKYERDHSGIILNICINMNTICNFIVRSARVIFHRFGVVASFAAFPISYASAMNPVYIYVYLSDM
jgi:hypothetical protein